MWVAYRYSLIDPALDVLGYTYIMSRICQITGKTKQNGKKVTKAWGVKYTSIHSRKVNLKKTTLIIDGHTVKAVVSARGIKSIRNGKIPGVQTVGQYVLANKEK